MPRLLAAAAAMMLLTGCGGTDGSLQSSEAADKPDTLSVRERHEKQPDDSPEWVTKLPQAAEAKQSLSERSVG